LAADAGLAGARAGSLVTGSAPGGGGAAAAWTPRTAPLARAYAAALGHAPVWLALGRLEELFKQLPNIASGGWTNTHYALRSLELVEAVVRP
jgi:hypothetical protein